ncbi:MAG TPA: extracellular solute-binding protein, partial [Firmicutes bacterium]|nr:extracellular solute-binding protein [Bacillota bacterium]
MKKNKGIATVGIMTFILSIIMGTIAFAAYAAPVEIEFLTPLWNEDVRKWYENEMIPEFEKLHPDIKVRIAYVTWNEYDDKRLVATAAGVGPDAWLVPAANAALQGYREQIIPLDEFVEKSKAEMNLGDFLPQALVSQQFEGKLYAIPNTLNLRTYVTNMDLFSKVGMDPKAPLGDWSDFIRLVRRLSGTYDYSKINSFKVVTMSQYWGAVLLESGVNWLGPNWELRFDSPEGVALINYLTDLFTAGGANPAMWTGGGLYDGTTAMAFTEIANLRAADKALGGGAYFLPEPVRQTAVFPITGFGISNASKNPEAAWKWILFHTNSENLTRFNAFYGRVPPRLSSMRSAEIMNDVLLRQAADVAA